MPAACSGGPSSGTPAAGDGSGAAAGGPSAAAPAVIEWRRLREPRERVSIGPGGLWLGPADGPRAHYLFARRRRGDDLALFAGSYASFRQLDGESELVFRGHGAAVAEAAERRMIAEWTRRVAVEAGGDGSPSPYGLAFAWHRGAATGGVCDDLAVYLSGEVHAGSCGGGEALGRLTSDRLERLYGWVDGLEPFQAAGEQGVRADALLDRLIFAGRGQRQASASDVAAIESLAGALLHELQAATAAASNAKAAAAVPILPADAAGPRASPASPAAPAKPPSGSKVQEAAPEAPLPPPAA